MSTTDDILAMLDAVEDRQIKCPKCGRSDDLYVCYPEFMTRAVGATLIGTLAEADDNDYISPPAHFNIPDRLIICGNFTAHDPGYDPKNGPAPWEWFQYPENTVVDYGASWAQVEVLRGTRDPDTVDDKGRVIQTP